MAAIGGPRTVTNGLVFELDAANQKSYGPAIVEALVVGGGGGGGWEMGGGGGGGGVLYGSAMPVTAGTAYSVTVGAGGTGRTSNADNTANAGNSTFSTLTALAGGAGGNNSVTYNGANTSGSPTSGASGGGDGEGQTLAPGTAGQGYAGGAAIESGYYHSGGGGGAGAPGNAGTSIGGGDGGIGLPFAISQSVTYYGGGGAGGTYNPSGPTRAGKGGLGGGGGANFSAAGSSGTANTGGGGGGGSYSPSSAGGAGGSGVVIIRYPGPQKATGGTITTADGYTVHTFTTSGTFTTGTNWSDGSGYNNTGVLTNGPTYNSANGGSIVLDGTNDIIQVPNTSGLLGYTGPITLMAWINGAGGLVISSGVSYGLFSEGSIRYWYWSASPNWINYSTVSSVITSNVWTHIAVSHTPGGSNLPFFYANGEAVASTGSLPTPINAGSAASLTIGEYNGYQPYSPYNGKVSNVQIYNRALTAAEVLQNFNALRGRFGI